ncbi:hypothetical protein TNCV_3252151 [Trichonephila clavipes]|nr:hypothetical protein TNCV_3252151 [Trichonephila clavipes]
MATLSGCSVRWLTYGNPKTGQAKKNRVQSEHRSFSPLTLLQHVEFTPALTFFPTCSDFWLDFPPVVRMACETKLLESEATTGFFVLLGEQGNNAVLDWVMKEGLIPPPERKGTIDFFSFSSMMSFFETGCWRNLAKKNGAKNSSVPD